MADSIRHIVREVYSEVLFELAEESGAVEDVMQDLSKVAELLRNESQFVAILASHTIKPQEKAQMVRRVFDGKVQPLMVDFLSVLARRNRISFLMGICDRYETLVDVYHQRRLVEVKVSHKLGEDELKKLKADLGEAIKSEVKLSVEVDPDMIGGIVIKKDDKVIDNTIRRALEEAVKSVVDKSRKKIQQMPEISGVLKSEKRGGDDEV